MGARGGEALVLRVAEYPSQVSPGERLRLVRDRHARFIVRRVGKRGQTVSGFDVAVSREVAALFVEAAREDGAVYAEIDVPEEQVARGRSTDSVLLELMRERPNEFVVLEEVRSELGREITRNGLYKAAHRLGESLPVIPNYGSGGGYALAVPVAARDGERCGSCAREIETHCPLVGEQVAADLWCVGWRRKP